jgi:hypothetical protein
LGPEKSNYSTLATLSQIKKMEAASASRADLEYSGFIIDRACKSPVHSFINIKYYPAGRGDAAFPWKGRQGWGSINTPQPAAEKFINREAP